MEEVTGHLCNVGQQMKMSNFVVDKQGRLLLTGEEWLT
jgi:hypothetical protein